MTQEDINRAFAESASELNKALIRELGKVMMMGEEEYEAYIRTRKLEDDLARGLREIADLKDKLKWAEKSVAWTREQLNHG